MKLGVGSLRSPARLPHTPFATTLGPLHILFGSQHSKYNKGSDFNTCPQHSNRYSKN